MSVSKIYNNTYFMVWQGQINYTTDTIKFAMLKSSYTINLNDHVTLEDLVMATNECDDVDYSRKTLTSKAITFDGINNRVSLNADNIEYLNSTISAAYGVVFQDTGDESTSNLIGVIDFEGTKSSTNGDFKIIWGAEGMLYIDIN
jgi:hypothetical protein